MRCRANAICGFGRDGKEPFHRFRPWPDAGAPLKMVGEDQGTKAGHRWGDVPGLDGGTFTKVEYDFANWRKSPARARLPQ